MLNIITTTHLPRPQVPPPGAKQPIQVSFLGRAGSRQLLEAVQRGLVLPLVEHAVFLEDWFEVHVGGEGELLAAGGGQEGPCHVAAADVASEE